MKRPSAHKRKLNFATNISTVLVLVSLTIFEIWHLANRTIELQHVGSVAYKNGWATLANLVAIASVAAMVAIIMFANHKFKFQTTNSIFLNRVILTSLLMISISLVITGVVATNKAKNQTGLCATLASSDYLYYSFTYNCPGSN